MSHLWRNWNVANIVATVRNPLRETRLYTPYYIIAFVTCHTTEYCSHRRTKWSDLYRVTHYATLFECPPKADIPSKRVNVSSWLLVYKQRSACPTVHYVIRELKQLYRTVLLAGFCLEPCPKLWTSPSFLRFSPRRVNRCNVIIPSAHLC